MSNFFFKKSSETRLFFATNRSGLLDFSWSTKDNHVIKVFCHAAPPNFGDVQPGFRQYDLSLDGQVSRAQWLLLYLCVVVHDDEVAFFAFCSPATNNLPIPSFEFCSCCASSIFLN